MITGARMRSTILVVAVCSGGTGCVSTMTPGGRSDFQQASGQDFEQVASCAYGALDAAHPGKVEFSDARRDSSVRMVLQDTLSGPLGGGRPRWVQVTVVAAPSGSTIELVSPTFDSETTWAEIRGCA